MRNIRRGLCLFAACCLVLGVAVSGAHASGQVRINTTTTTMNSSNAAFNILTSLGGIPLTCLSVSMITTLTSGGMVWIPPGSASFSGCRLAGISVSVSQTISFTGRITSLLSGSTATGMLLAISLPFHAIRVQGAGNDFYIGAGSTGALVAINVPVGVLVNVGTGTFANSGLLWLNLMVTRVTSTNLGVAVSQLVGFTGFVSFAPAINGAAI